MPAKTGRQYRAMAAAMSGNSTLGIPGSVGREFVEATPPAKRKRFAKKHKKSERYEQLSRMRG